MRCGEPPDVAQRFPLAGADVAEPAWPRAAPSGEPKADDDVSCRGSFMSSAVTGDHRRPTRRCDVQSTGGYGVSYQRTWPVCQAEFRLPPRECVIAGQARASSCGIADKAGNRPPPCRDKV